MGRFVPKCVLIDLSGTVHIENSIVAGAARAIDRIRKSGISFRFVTNSSKESVASLFTRLVGLGVNLSPGDLFTSLTATKQYVLRKNCRPMLFLEENAQQDFKDVSVVDPNSVVIGLAPSMFNYEKLTEAFNCLKNADNAELIAINKSRYLQRQHGLVLGGGAFVAALEYSTGLTATVVGKPSRKFFEQSIADFEGVEVEDCVMIGDDVQDDVAGAQAIGMKGILVQTGKYRPGDETKINPAPYLTLPSLVDAIDHVIELHSNGCET